MYVLVSPETSPDASSASAILYIYIYIYIYIMYICLCVMQIMSFGSFWLKSCVILARPYRVMTTEHSLSGSSVGKKLYPTIRSDAHPNHRLLFSSDR